jgi:hypothetical protein
LPTRPFFASACVIFRPAARCFISAAAVIAASVIAVPVAGKKLAVCSSAKPIAATNRPPRDVTIIETVSGRFAGAAWSRKKV